MQLKRIKLLDFIFLTFILFFLISTSFFPLLHVSGLQNNSYQLISSSGTVDYTPPEPPPSAYPFWSTDSYWHMKIPENAPLHPNSAQMIDWLLTTDGHRSGRCIVQWKDWCPPIWDATEDTPRVTVYKSDKVTPRHYNVPIDPSWQPDDTLDHEMGIIDWPNRKYYWYWRFYKEGSIYYSSDGHIFDLDGSGVAPNGVHMGGGSSVPYLAIQIRPEEIEVGVINHPLGCALSTPKANSKVYPPASTSDGRTTATYAIPEGARIQLDPNLDLDSLGLSRTAKIIAKAMQDYGIVVKECGGSFAVYGEHDLSADWGSDMANGMLWNLPTDKWRIVNYSVFGAVEEYWNFP